ncbi:MULTISPECIES: hypothetical protein [unclassified Corynebacterium]|uniref:SWIM zinc finger family protein n=1 Tax=unclassified Corynebacterium TaxID=2624378 RepID=UPI002655E2DB|nr:MULTISPECIES: hypothetical protein [unclassified Corynebacterium]MDN8594843.1 hypothetical protein [Corynebacterium sp. P4_F2]WKK56310.1 hypothetical protein QYR03_03605 [Corynebacterium sp. P4-C1]
MPRPQMDNVTYVNFGARRKVDSAAETTTPHDESETTRAEILRFNEAARTIYRAAQQGTDQGRFSRGRKYAEQGNVLEVRPEPGRFTATVAGTQNEPFTTLVILPYRDSGTIRDALSIMSHNSNALAEVRNGYFSRELLDCLFAGADEKIRFRCDCPDDSRVCKHGVAAAIKAAELIDADPTLLFRLRNLDLNTLERQLRESAGERAKESAEEGSEFFWDGHVLPHLPDPKIAPMIEDSDLDLLHKAMQTISFTNIDQLRAVSDLEDLYDELTRR